MDQRNAGQIRCVTLESSEGGGAGLEGDDRDLGMEEPHRHDRLPRLAPMSRNTVSSGGAKNSSAPKSWSKGFRSRDRYRNCAEYFRFTLAGK